MTYETAVGETVQRLTPVAVAAFNDCSIRQWPGTSKLSHKKNWGPRSKGVSPTWLRADDLSPKGPTSTLRLAGFLQRDGTTHAYGIDTAVLDYSYYGSQLLDWIVDRLHHQAGAERSPLEPVGDYLRTAGNPTFVLVGIGSTRYTRIGNTTFLQRGDQTIVVLYDAAITAPDEVADAVANGTEATLPTASVLRQLVVTA